MRKNQNNCSVYVTFKKGTDEPQTVELCGMKGALVYIKDVVLKNNWKFISMTRGSFEYTDR